MLNRSLVILVLTAALAAPAFAAPAPTATGTVNLNTATAQELQLLPRVGPALAQRILDFRTTNGAFKVATELTRVKGIGEKSFALLEPYVAISGTTTLKQKVRLPRAKSTVKTAALAD